MRHVTSHDVMSPSVRAAAAAAIVNLCDERCTCSGVGNRSSGHGSPDQRFWLGRVGSGRVTGQCDGPVSDPVFVALKKKLI